MPPASVIQTLPPDQIDGTLDFSICLAGLGSKGPLPGHVGPGTLRRPEAVAAFSVCMRTLDRDITAKSTVLSRTDDAIHDEYFRIARIEGDRPAIFVRNLIEVRQLIAAEFFDPTLATLEVVDKALIPFLRSLLGECVATATVVPLTEVDVVPPITPMQRWVRGHQLFAILTQALIYCFDCMVRSQRISDTESACLHADRAIQLLYGSAEIFRFTGGFAPLEYETIIRPSMMPPLSPICLSGLMSVDHRHLVQQLRVMRPALVQFRTLDRSRHDALACALSHVYDAHIHVCQRFVGNQPSIRTAESTETSGPQLLENFRKLRLRPFDDA